MFVTLLVIGVVVAALLFGVGLGVYVDRKKRYKSLWRAESRVRKCTAASEDMEKMLSIVQEELTRTDEYMTATPLPKNKVK